MMSRVRRRLHLLGRAGRRLVLRLASPVDRVALVLNGKGRYPPLHLRRQGGPLEAFERTAGEYAAYLTVLAGLRPQSRVLDVGCGSGAMALVLGERLGPGGRYLGFDVDRSVTRWATSHLADERFSFEHFDYWNATYDPGGVRFKPWPVSDGWADIVLLKSVFTHLLPEDGRFYVQELARALRPEGTALVTAFVFNEVNDVVRHRFPLAGDGFRYARAGSPESGIAYPRGWFQTLFAESGLSVEWRPGFWQPGRPEPTAFQDLLTVGHLR